MGYDPQKRIEKWAIQSGPLLRIIYKMELHGAPINGLTHWVTGGKNHPQKSGYLEDEQGYDLRPKQKTSHSSTTIPYLGVHGS